MYCTGMSHKCVLRFHLDIRYSMSSKHALLVGYHICDILEHCIFWVLQLHSSVEIQLDSRSGFQAEACEGH